METEKSKIKVLHVLNSNSYSGAENVAITIINGIKEEFEVAYTSPDGSIRNYLEENNIKYFPINERSLTVKEFKRIVYTYKPDIIHAHDFTASVIASFVAKKIPIINHLHNNCPWLKKYGLKSLSYLLAAYKAKQILTVSESVMNEYVFGWLFNKKTKVIGNPIDIKSIRDKAENALIKESSDVIFLGRLSTPKNPFMFLEIVAELIKKIPDLKVAMVGTGELEKDIKDRCHELKLDDNIKFYGFQKNPYGLLKSSKILCLPSLWEGFGLVAVEALILGIPIVCSPVGGLVNIADESCGCFCNTKIEFVNALEKILLSDSALKVLKRGTNNKIAKFSNISDYIYNIKSYYIKCYGNKKI